jgi:hypothetical protein
MKKSGTPFTRICDGNCVVTFGIGGATVNTELYNAFAPAERDCPDSIMDKLQNAFSRFVSAIGFKA